ncbi:MAG: hypothetical protein C4288_04200 [Leptolyngbya sp. ERB_1_1]
MSIGKIPEFFQMIFSQIAMIQGSLSRIQRGTGCMNGYSLWSSEYHLFALVVVQIRKNLNVVLDFS